MSDEPTVYEQSAKVEMLAEALIDARSPVQGAVAAFVVVGYECPGDEGVAITIIAAYREAEGAGMRRLIAARLRGMADDMEHGRRDGLTGDVPS